MGAFKNNTQQHLKVLTKYLSLSIFPKLFFFKFLYIHNVNRNRGYKLGIMNLSTRVLWRYS